MESLSIEQQIEAVRLLDRLHDIIEKTYPRYHSCQRVAELNDFWVEIEASEIGKFILG